MISSSVPGLKDVLWFINMASLTCPKNIGDPWEMSYSMVTPYVMQPFRVGARPLEGKFPLKGDREQTREGDRVRVGGLIGE